MKKGAAQTRSAFRLLPRFLDGQTSYNRISDEWPGNTLPPVT
jgi:hypothetical protein